MNLEALNTWSQVYYTCICLVFDWDKWKCRVILSNLGRNVRLILSRFYINDCSSSGGAERIGSWTAPFLQHYSKTDRVVVLPNACSLNQYFASQITFIYPKFNTFHLALSVINARGTVASCIGSRIGSDTMHVSRFMLFFILADIILSLTCLDIPLWLIHLHLQYFSLAVFVLALFFFALYS